MGGLRSGLLGEGGQTFNQSRQNYRSLFGFLFFFIRSPDTEHFNLICVLGGGGNGDDADVGLNLGRAERWVPCNDGTVCLEHLRWNVI